MSIDYKKLLSDPFEEGDVEWRVQSYGHKADQTPWVRVIPYITSRAVQQRLDDIFGIDGWENAFKPTPDGRGMLCGITLHFENRSVTKWDGAEIPRALTDVEINKGKKQNIDPIKTALSNATKRANVQLGVGRYLYNLEIEFALVSSVTSRFKLSEGGTYIEIKIDKNKSSYATYEWFPPKMPDWAMPSAKSDSLINDIKTATDLILLRVAYQKAYKYANSFNRGDLLKEIIQTKDIRKKSLEGDSKAETQEEERKIREWLEIKVTDLIFSAKNESVLKLAKAEISKGLKQKSLDHEVDIMEMMKILEDYYQKHLNKLNFGAQ